MLQMCLLEMLRFLDVEEVVVEEIVRDLWLLRRLLWRDFIFVTKREIGG